MSTLSFTPSVARGFGLLPSSPTQRALRVDGPQTDRVNRPAVLGRARSDQPVDAVAFSPAALDAAARLEVGEAAFADQAAEPEEDLAGIRAVGDQPAGEESEAIDADASTEAPGETSDAEGEEDIAAPRGADGEPLTDAEVEQVRELRARDLEVRQHEQAHAAVGGPYVTSGPQYEFQQGPDGRRYAVGGNVGIDVSPEATPEETLIKARTVRRAALAPAEPSAQDYRVAAQATRLEQQARTELREQQEAETQASDESDEDPAAPADSSEQAESIDFFA